LPKPAAAATGQNIHSRTIHKNVAKSVANNNDNDHTTGKVGQRLKTSTRSRGVAHNTHTPGGGKTTTKKSSHVSSRTVVAGTTTTTARRTTATSSNNNNKVNVRDFDGEPTQDNNLAATIGFLVALLVVVGFVAAVTIYLFSTGYHY
jgi:hypothetical protein